MRQAVEREGKVIVTVVDGVRQESIGVSAGQSVLDALRQNGVYVNAPCGGRGTCGKCKISLLEGRLRLPAGEFESGDFIEADNDVLACRAFLTEDCKIDVGRLKERGFAGTSDFNVPADGHIDAGIETLRFTPSAGIWNSGRSVTDVINSALGRDLDFAPKALRQLSVWMGEVLKSNYSRPEADQPVFLTVRGNRAVHAQTLESAPVYGMGVDIGTTTVSLSLVELETGKVRKSMSLLNSQRQYGADVISRIQKGNEGFAEELRSCIISDISRGINAICEGETEAVISIAVAGNTTMMHLLLGLRSGTLAVSPFNPVTTGLLKRSSGELFGAFPVDCEVTLLPSIGAFMGADIVAGMMSCKMDQYTGIALFIDVGTNGELAIGGRDRILCVSTAAGPAFEGANITWGTGSIPGAIAKFDLKNGEVSFRTIEDAPPVGICGSGVVDIIASCLRAGIIDRTGLFKSGATVDGGLKIAQNQAGEWIRFTQKDVREFQLAKSAIRSGLEILVQEFGCRWENIEQVYLAGGFGTRINVENAVEVGLFPGQLQDKIQSVGNSALGGTVQYLLFRERREAVNELTQVAAVIDLSQHRAFNDLFMENLLFETKL